MGMSDRRRESFREFLLALEAKQNSQLISEEKANQIKRVLQSEGPADTPRFRFYVRRKGFKLIDLPTLGLKDVLCVPAPKVRLLH